MVFCVCCYLYVSDSAQGELHDRIGHHPIHSITFWKGYPPLGIPLDCVSAAVYLSVIGVHGELHNMKSSSNFLDTPRLFLKRMQHNRMTLKCTVLIPSQCASHSGSE